MRESLKMYMGEVNIFEMEFQTWNKERHKTIQKLLLPLFSAVVSSRSYDLP